jgi:hypothetical protein
VPPYFGQQTRKGKYGSAAVFNTILTLDDGQCRPKHVVCRRQSENDTTCNKSFKILKFMLYFIIEF